MKEKFVKVKESLNGAIELLKTEKFEEAIAGFTKAFEDLETLESEAVANTEELAKSKKSEGEEKTELAKMKEEMKKWVDMYVTAECMEDLLKEIKEGVSAMETGFKDSITEMSQEIEALKKTSLGSKQMVKAVGEDGKDLFEGVFIN